MSKRLLADRAELAGLPFLKGDRCRLDSERALQLGRGGTKLRGTEAIGLSVVRRSATDFDNSHYLISDYFHEQGYGGLPAAMQILAVQDPRSRRTGFENDRNSGQGRCHDRRLVRLVLFDPDAGVRASATLALGSKPVAKYGPKLVDGFRHPWHVVAEEA